MGRERHYVGLEGFWIKIASTEIHSVSRAALSSVCRNAQMSLAKATAVSDMRLEKPHSFSYQDRTRTKLPTMTFV